MVHLVVGEGTSIVKRPIGLEPTLIGRGPRNHVVLDERSISGRHLSVWVSAGGIWVEDHASRNGTWRVNGTRIHGVASVAPGETLRLGLEQTIMFEGEVPADEHRPLVVEQSTGAAFPIVGRRFTFADTADADVVSPDERVVLVTDVGGELWLHRDDEERLLEPGELFRVGGRAFFVRGNVRTTAATWELADDRHPYRVEAVLDGPEGPCATVFWEEASHVHRVRSANRATLLYLLARQLQDDRAADQPVPMEGWLDDVTIATGIWGRSGDAKRLNVLVARLRKELRTARLSPWCLEKKRGQTRLLVAEARVAP
jgi:hypothetical protein